MAYGKWVSDSEKTNWSIASLCIINLCNLLGIISNIHGDLDSLRHVIWVQPMADYKTRVTVLNKLN